MVFSLFINHAPMTGIDQSPALLTAKAILAGQHELYRVFFYADGVCHYKSDSDLCDWPWQRLAAATSTDLCFCSASVKNHNVSLAKHTNVSLGGLVQLLDAQMNSDRVVSLR